ncbi:FAD-dependent monooxygenase [Streptomyces sp. SID5606]|uniref:FAD-dependent monooxygenase n=1 Tax=Streptomyces sp. SID5606 TaxID=2690305 RepID=UPI002351331D|nr:FAD-dependent monooxygenase [Streptomyces sp. SID5606]
MSRPRACCWTGCVTTAWWPPWTTPPRPRTPRSSSACSTNAPPARPRSPVSTWSSRFRVHHRVADRYRNGRLLLAGDAAHVHSPAGGQGMNTGIQDGYALGHAIAAGRLDDYEAQRRPVARRVVAFIHRMTRVATARSRVISDPAPRPARPSAPGSRAR